MPTSYPTPSEDQLIQLLDSPNPVAPGTFEVGLVLGGTVSAGCYTAGVLDFIFQALDAWEAARNSGMSDIPSHRLIIRGITGASGGGVNGAIAARALSTVYPPVSAATAAGSPRTDNPFYDVWVDGITLTDLLNTGDLESGANSSLLNGSVLQQVGSNMATFAGPPSPERGYLANPLPITLTLTNLTGIPNRTSLDTCIQSAPPASQLYYNSADWARISVAYPGPNVNPRPDEFQLDFQGLPASGSLLDWPSFYQFALATAAFPIGFPPILLNRPLSQYCYRAVVEALPTGPGGALQEEIVPLVPDWSSLIDPNTGQLPDPYQFLTVDGGATNNEPLELARTALAGIRGTNPRDGSVATRAVILVDPFAGSDDAGPSKPQPVLGMTMALLNGLLGQNRYDSADLLLATEPTVFSRFMISASRTAADGTLRTGGQAIASSGLMAVIGFACRDYRVHDYLLGRYNAWSYLKNELVMPDTNLALFTGTWSETAKEAFGVFDPDGKRYLPLIPLYGATATEPVTVPWPINALDPSIYKDALEARFSALAKANGPTGGIASILLPILSWLAEGDVADWVTGIMTTYIQENQS
jgi:hypothetical protein